MQSFGKATLQCKSKAIQLCISFDSVVQILAIFNNDTSLGFPCGLVGKESTCKVGDLGSIPGLGRSSRGGHGNPLKILYLEKPHGQRSLTGYSPWDHKEWDMTERLSLFLELLSKSIWQFHRIIHFHINVY